ncbi:MAG: tetratricopeptide repeat protein, partial [Chitinophagaceae bacterium]|nr:tetratricopeptide repeat protein [Chitinophagaceae bacterium]
MNNRFNCLWVLLTLLTSFPFLVKGQIDNGLMEAIKNCDTQAVQQRLKNNININATDSNGANALMWAAYDCDVPIVKQLVQQGAKVADTGVIYVDVQSGDYFTSVQGIAAAKGKLGLLKYLADSLHLPLDEKEYDPYTRKKDSWTPLCWAINSGQIEVVDYLLQKGANVHVINNSDGTTPLVLAATYAATNKDWSIFDLLIKRGGKEKLGDQADNIIYAAAELSQQSQAQADWNTQLALQQLIFQLRKIYFGETHLAYALSLNYLAYLYHLMGRYDKALPLYEQAIAIAKRTVGKEDNFYASIVHSLAYLYKQIGQNEKALSFTEQATAIAKRTLGEDHRDYATSLQSLASLYADMGQYKKALSLMEQAAAIRKKALGEESSDYALSLLELGYLYQRLSQYEKALALYEQAIAIRKKVLGEEHPFYAKSLNYLASLYHQMARYEKALPLYEQALAIRKKALGEEHPDYAQNLNDLSVLYQDMKQYDKALVLFSDASTRTLK